MAISYSRDIKLLLLLIWLVALSTGCATTVSTTPKSTKPLKTLKAQKIKKHTTYKKIANKKGALLAKKKQPLPKPKFKELSPLEIQLVTMSFVDEDYKSIFRALAQAGGFNLIIHESARPILEQGLKLTAEFVEQPVKDVLNAVCKASNLAWEEQDGTIFILGYVEKVINLDFIAATHQAQVTVGGDVLGGQSGGSGGDSGGGSSGGSGGDITTPLTGSFTITGETSADATDIYKELDAAIKDYLEGKGKYFLNRNTGTLFVKGPPNMVAKIEKYISHLKQKYNRQVLIEARIVEVELKDAFELGIDWKHLSIDAGSQPINPEGTFFNMRSTVLTGLQDSVLYGVSLSNPYYNLTTIVRALEEFGKIRTLSNPRLKVLNGQPAMISVGQSVSYLKKFETVVDIQDGNTNESPNAEIASIFNGILLGVTPVIDDKKNVTLNLVPIKSDIIALNQESFGRDMSNTYTFPIVNLREASTTVKAKSGDLVIIGGLIEDRVENHSSGLPFLSRLPGILGAAFTHKEKSKKKVELVIILKIDVIENEQTI